MRKVTEMREKKRRKMDAKEKANCREKRSRIGMIGAI